MFSLSLALGILQFLEFVLCLPSQDACKSVIPGHTFSLKNTTITDCFFPLEHAENKFCEVAVKNSKGYPRCVDNAKCIVNPSIPQDSSVPTICSCEKNHKMTSLFTCNRIKKVAEICQTWPYPMEGRGELIDDCHHGALCVEDVCQCRAPDGDGICLLGPGFPCDHTGSNQTGRCVPHSACIPIPQQDFGICTCEDGYYSGWSTNTIPECRKLRGFGERCVENRGEDCNEIMGLKCRSGVCMCDVPNPDAPNTCLIKVRGQCKTGYANCIKNAECNAYGRCTCMDGYVEGNNDELLCRKLLYLGESCDYRTESCDYESGLTCDKAKCRCRNEKTEDGKSCLLNAGEQCRTNGKGPCAANATCKPYEYSPQFGTCTCLQGLVSSNRDSRCHQIMNKGTPCSEGSYKYEHFCDKKFGLDCKGLASGGSSVCACPYGETADGKCKLLVGADCSLDPSTPACPPRSKCEGYGDYKSCKCEPNHVRGGDSLSCVPERKYLETCGESIGVCVEGVGCLEGICQCRDPSEKVFDPASGKCKNKNRCESNSDCPTHGICQPLSSGSSVKWCECSQGYTKDSSSLCKANYLTVCTGQDDCLISKSMGCIDGVCRCSAVLSQLYDVKQTECVGLVGSPCGTQNGKCVEGAVCRGDICRCPAGTTLLNGQCVKLVGFLEICSNDGTERGIVSCDWTKGLACVNKMCSCVDPNMEYLPGQGECVVKAGNICGLKIPVGSCTEEERCSGALGQEKCNYYKISCAPNNSCKDDEKGDFRCLW